MTKLGHLTIITSTSATTHAQAANFLRNGRPTLPKYAIVSPVPSAKTHLVDACGFTRRGHGSHDLPTGTGPSTVSEAEPRTPRTPMSPAVPTKARREDVFFAATGITDGELLKGVRYLGDGVKTDTLVVRGLTGTVRQIIATHSMEKLHHFGAIKY